MQYRNRFHRRNTSNRVNRRHPRRNTIMRSRKLYERNAANEAKLDKLFDELVPAMGEADTVAGEIVRALCRLGYRYYNDGDILGGVNGIYIAAPAGYLYAQIGREKNVGKYLDELYDEWREDKYENILDKLVSAVLDVLDDHPEYREKKNFADCTSNSKWGGRFPAEEYYDYDYDEEDDGWYY